MGTLARPAEVRWRTFAIGGYRPFTPARRSAMLAMGVSARDAARHPAQVSNHRALSLLAGRTMSANINTAAVRNGDRCVVERGTHAGKSGVVSDCRASKTGHVTITVAQADGIKFKTLARNVSKVA